MHLGYANYTAITLIYQKSKCSGKKIIGEHSKSKGLFHWRGTAEADTRLQQFEIMEQSEEVETTINHSTIEVSEKDKWLTTWVEKRR